MENREQAEIQRLLSETEKNLAEKKKLELESAELRKRLNRNWFTGRAFIEALIGGVVGAALLAAWLVGYFGPILSAKHELARLENSKLKIEVEKEKENNERVREHLEKQRKQHESQLKQFAVQNNALKTSLEKAEKRAVALKEQLQDKIRQYDKVARTEADRTRFKTLAAEAKKEVAQVKAHIDSLQSEKEEAQARANQVYQQIGSLDNARYDIAVYGLNAPKDKYDSIRQFFLNRGYSIDRGYNYSRRPDWLAFNSTVFFYHKDTEQKAKQIAGELSKIAESKFRVSRGAGFRVNKGEEEWTIFVHYIPE